MKHLKLFESNTNLYWIVLTHYKYSGEYYYDLFEDEESAKNYIIDVVNEQKNYQEIEIDDFLWCEEALKWHNDYNSGEIILSYNSVELSDKYKLNDEIRMKRDEIRFNL